MRRRRGERDVDVRRVDNVDVDEEEALRGADVRDGVMMKYSRLLRARLLLELSTRNGLRTESVLVPYLKKHDFWLRAVDAHAVLNSLGIEPGGFEIEYVRDVRIWMRDRRGIRTPSPPTWSEVPNTT